MDSITYFIIIISFYGVECNFFIYFNIFMESVTSLSKLFLSIRYLIFFFINKKEPLNCGSFSVL